MTDNLAKCQMTTAGLADGITDLRALVVEQSKLLESVSKVVEKLGRRRTARRP